MRFTFPFFLEGHIVHSNLSLILCYTFALLQYTYNLGGVTLEKGWKTMWVICVLVWYSQPLTSIFGLVNSSIKKIRLEWRLHPTHSMDRGHSDTNLQVSQMINPVSPFCNLLRLLPCKIINCCLIFSPFLILNWPVEFCVTVQYKGVDWSIAGKI